jgi:restriction endonuclease S subunit
MDMDLFLNQKIPLPRLEEQNKIVNDFLNKINEAEQFKIDAEDLENKIEKYLFYELGIIKNSGIGISKGLQTIDFVNIDKWSLDDIFRKNTIITKKYKLEKLDTLCSLITDGTHQTPTYYREGVIFLSAKNVTKEIINWDEVKYVSKEAHNEYVRRVKPEIDDILLAKNGTTGVAAIIDVEKDFSIYVSLALLKPIKEKVYPKYLLYLINSEICRIQFFSRLIGIGVPNLHLGEIKEVVIPLPPLNIQNEILNNIDLMKIKIAQLKNTAKTLQLQAKREFEQVIFNS